MRAVRLAGLVARQRPKALRRSLLVAQIAQASHAAPKLGGNIRLVTRNKGCGQPWTGRAFEIPIRELQKQGETNAMYENVG
jgi:hypothetical protein